MITGVRQTRWQACAVAGLALVLAATVVRAGPAAAQAWPDHPVKIIVPYAAGGNTDAIARLMGQRLSEVLGQQFVVDNRAGASGTLAVDAVVRSPPDGYTLLLASLPQMAVVPAMMKVNYDPMKDLVPISNIGANAFVLAVNPSLPIKTAQEFVAYMKQRPGQLSYASGGVGSQMNLTMALFLKRNNLDIQAVHMRGGSEPTNAVVAGHVPIAMLNASDAFEQVSAGAMRALGISTDKRSPQAPAIPTFAEQGFKDFVITAWNGLAAPAGTPQPIVDRLAAEVAKALRDPKLAERYRAIGVEPNGNSPKEYVEDFKAAIALWGDTVRSLGIKLEEAK